MSTAALLCAAFGLAATSAAEPNRFAAIEKEFQHFMEETKRPLPATLELITLPEPTKVRAPDFLEPYRRPSVNSLSSLRRPVPAPEASVPALRRLHIRIYDAPERFGRPLPPPHDDFETLRLRSQQR